MFSLTVINDPVFLLSHFNCVTIVCHTQSQRTLFNILLNYWQYFTSQLLYLGSMNEVKPDSPPPTQPLPLLLY